MSDISVEQVPGKAAVVRFNRPHKRNAFSRAMWQELATVVTTLGLDPEIRLIVLTGGPHFSAGADISEFSELRSTDQQAAAYEAVVEESYKAILNSPKTIVAAISGFCVGGGCALATACDFRIGDLTSRVGIPAAKLGVVYTPFEIRMLYNQVGLANAKRILFEGTIYPVDETRSMGFFDLIHDGDPVEAALAFSETIRSNAPLSIAAAKKTLNSIAEDAVERDAAEIARLTAVAVASRDYREGVAAFTQKRPPVFTGT